MCPDCQSDNIEEVSTDGLGNISYDCLDCGHNFDSTEIY